MHRRQQREKVTPEHMHLDWRTHYDRFALHEQWNAKLAQTRYWYHDKNPRTFAWGKRPSRFWNALARATTDKCRGKVLARRGTHPIRSTRFCLKSAEINHNCALPELLRVTKALGKHNVMVTSLS